MLEYWKNGSKKNKTQSTNYCLGFLALMEYFTGEKQKTNVWSGSFKM
jgi:hypothetical protein